MLPGIPAQQFKIGSRSRQFAGMPDQPLFQTHGVKLGMALKGQSMTAESENLVFAAAGRSEQCCIRRQIEGIAMPVEH